MGRSLDMPTWFSTLETALAEGVEKDIVVRITARFKLSDLEDCVSIVQSAEEDIKSVGEVCSVDYALVSERLNPDYIKERTK